MALLTIDSALTHAIEKLPEEVNELWVAFSGGLDSTVLLHALKQRLSIFPKQYTLSALHINHHLQVPCETWAQHCQDFSQKLGVSCHLEHVYCSKARGISLEAEARELRYHALKKHSQQQRAFFTGHHADDQAETLLLQLFRGSGLAGLSAMAEQTHFDASILVRPFLAVTQEKLQQYAHKHQLNWIEDPSNQQLNFDRNYLRHQIMPLVKSNWPGIVACLNRTASHCSEANQFIEATAADDLKIFANNLGNILYQDRLQKLPVVRIKYILRKWLKAQQLPMPSTAKLQTIIDTVVFSQHQATPCVTWTNGEVRRFKNEIHALLPLKTHDLTWQATWDLKEDLVLPNQMGIIKKNDYLSLKEKAPVLVKFRQGGEKLYDPLTGKHYRLKNKLQQWSIPPWLRAQIPLIFKDNQLIAVHYPLS